MGSSEIVIDPDPETVLITAFSRGMSAEAEAPRVEIAASSGFTTDAANRSELVEEDAAEDDNAALGAEVEVEVEEVVQLAPMVAPSKAYGMIAGSLICLAGYNTIERPAMTTDSSVVNTSTRSTPGEGVSFEVKQKQ